MYILTSSITASLAPLGSIFGGLLAGVPLGLLGRRGTLLASSVLFLAAFLTLATSSFHEIIPVMLVARGSMGFTVGLAIPATQIYV